MAAAFNWFKLCLVKKNEKKNTELKCISERDCLNKTKNALSSVCVNKTRISAQNSATYRTSQNQLWWFVGSMHFATKNS